MATLAADIELERRPVHATLSDSGVLRWEGTSGSGSLVLRKDLLGFRRGPSTIMLFTFCTAEGGCCAGPTRKRKDILLDFHDAAQHNDWTAHIQGCLEGRPRRLLVVLNPKGGAGLAKRLYEREVLPLFTTAGIEVTLRETQYYRHAANLARDLELDSFDGVACVSGDGVVVEVLNGLLMREDWKQAVAMPIGHIPAGSGNGMAKSLLDEENQACNAANAAFAIICGRTVKMDVATLSQGPVRFHLLLNVTWGIASDVDLESEKYRWMGGFRLTFQALVRIINLRRYRGSFSYLLAAEGGDAAAGAAAGGVEMRPTPGGGGGGSGLAGEGQSERLLGGASVGGSGEGHGNGDGYVGPARGVRAMEKEGGWKVMEGEFILVWLQNVPWAATDMKCTPLAKLNDGCLDMLVVRSCSRLQLLRLFLQMEKGAHIGSRHVEYFKIRAIRMDPGGRTKGNRGGIISADGEVMARGAGAFGAGDKDHMVYSQPFEIAVQQGLATVFCPQQ